MIEPEPIEVPHGSNENALYRLRSAVYLDFDNVFSGLMELDEEAAIAFAQRPGQWLDRLRCATAPPESWRDFLIRRCYLNPAGWRSSERYGNDQHRLYFSRFRPFLIRVGFEVIDCPPLTSRGKNAADIRIALDIVDALRHSTRFDEFIVLSADADFTPVLQRVREHDRRTLVISSGQTASAYEATVDVFLDEQGLIDLVLGDDTLQASDAEQLDSLGAAAAPYPAPAHAETNAAVDLEALRERAVLLTLRELDAASEPVPLATLANAIRRDLGEVVDTSEWFGRGTLSAAIRDERTAHLERSVHHIWDPQRHGGPAVRRDRELPEVVQEVAAVTGMPRLARDEFRAAFAELASWAAENPFNLTAITREVRDRLHATGYDIGRQTLGFIVRGSMYGGVPLNQRPAPSAEDVAGAFLRSVMQAAASARLELGEDERAVLSGWIRASGDAPA